MTPLTDEDLARFERLGQRVRPAQDNGHSQACGCPECATAWSRGADVADAMAEIAECDVVGRLVAENERLRQALTVSERDASALMDRLSEPAPSDKAAAERSVCVEQEKGGKAVSLQSTPDNFIVLARGLGDYDADIIAGSMQNILECILSDHVAQLRAELAADRAAVRALVEKLPRCEAAKGCERLATRDYDAPLRALQARMVARGDAALVPVSATAEADPDDSPRCEVCCGPARNDDPDRAYSDEDAIYACGACALKLDAGDHTRDVATIRHALEAGTDPAEAIDWPAFWQRRRRLGAAAEAIEAPVRATVEWMRQEATLSSEATARNHSGSSGEPDQEAGATRAVPAPAHRALDRLRAMSAVWADAEVPVVPPEPDDEESRYDAEAAVHRARELARRGLG